MDLEIHRFTLAALPVEDDQIVFDQNIKGWHEEVFTADRNGWPLNGCYSNTPTLGYGNSFYAGGILDWLADMHNAIVSMSEADTLDPSDTCLFWRWDIDAQHWECIEVRPVQSTVTAEATDHGVDFQYHRLGND